MEDKNNIIYNNKMLLAIFMVISVILLFVSMILSATSADNINKAINYKSGDSMSQADRYKKGYDYAKYSAIVTGVGILFIVLAFVVYMYASPSSKSSSPQLPPSQPQYWPPSQPAPPSSYPQRVRPPGMYSPSSYQPEIL